MRRALIGLAVLLAALVALGVAAVLLRPAAPGSPAASATPSPVPTVTPAEPSPPPVDAAEQHRIYRAYVSTVVVGGTAVVAGILGLAGCREGRDECVHRLELAADHVARLQDGLAAHPAPDCLAAADERLQDALAFQRQGIEAATAGVRDRNRVELLQGLLLTSVGLWRGGAAVVAGRGSDC